MPDKTYYLWILIFTELVLLVPLVLCLVEFTLGGFLIMLFTFIFTNFFMISPFFGYAELRDGELYIKFGFFLNVGRLPRQCEHWLAMTGKKRISF